MLVTPMKARIKKGGLKNEDLKQIFTEHMNFEIFEQFNFTVVCPSVKKFLMNNLFQLPRFFSNLFSTIELLNYNYGYRRKYIYFRTFYLELPTDKLFHNVLKFYITYFAKNPFPFFVYLIKNV